MDLIKKMIKIYFLYFYNGYLNYFVYSYRFVIDLLKLFLVMVFIMVLSIVVIIFCGEVIKNYNKSKVDFYRIYVE